MAAFTSTPALYAGRAAPFIATRLAATQNTRLPVAVCLLAVLPVGLIATALLEDSNNKDVSQE